MTMSMTTTTPVSPLRVTRRGRALLLLTLVAVLLAAFSLGRARSEAAPVGGPNDSAVVQQTTVQAGESLWTVARRIAPANDPREVIAQLRRLNDLSSSDLRVGQQLLLPVPA